MISRLNKFHLFVLIASACLMIQFTSSWGVAGENYNSSDVKYPDGFRGNTNNQYVQLQELDAVNLQGNQVIFFSVSAKDDTDGYDDYLYYYLPKAKDIPHGSVMITNNNGSFPFSDSFNFKACVFNDIAYVFYTPMADWGNFNTSSIYYLTFYFNAKTNKWTFGPVNGFSTGVPGTSISFAEVMNGEMYVFFTSQGSGGYDWYYMKTSDGQSFGTGTQFYSNNDSSLLSAGGSVFAVPDVTNVAVEKMMIIYVTMTSENVSSVKYMFFDGTSQYGLSAVPNVPNVSPWSARLFNGGASGYNKTQYSIQAFLASPDTNTENDVYMFHAEYLPDGPNGDQGSWSAWTQLSNSSNDRIVSYWGTSVPWAVIPSFTKVENSDDIQEYLSIWYSRGTDHSGTQDYMQCRSSSYASDYLKQDNAGITSPVPASSQDLTSSTIIGVIQGTPPWPLNGNQGPFPGSANISVVNFGSSQSDVTSTTVTVGGGIVAGYGKEFLKSGINTKLTAGVNYTHESSTTITKSTDYTMDPFSLTNPPGPDNEGILLVFQPEIINTRYLQESYDQGPLQYGSDGSPAENEFTVSIIQYGQGSILATWSYYLQTPDQGYSYSSALTGMLPQYLSTDIPNWAEVVTPQYNNPQYFTVAPVLTLAGTAGVVSVPKIATSTTTGSSWAPSANFSVDATLLGFSVGANVNFSMNMSTSTTMTNYLGFQYNMLGCATPGGYAELDVTPVILTASTSGDGSSCPWISDDIRTSGKPLPWSLSYQVSPLGTCESTPTTLSVSAASGKCTLDRVHKVNDTMKLTLQFQGLPPDFQLDKEKPFFVRLGNYGLDTRSNPIKSKTLARNDLTVEMGELGNPRAKILMKVTHLKKQKALKVNVQGEHMNLSRLYGFPNKTIISGKLYNLPSHLFVGDALYADQDLSVLYTGQRNKSGFVRILGLVK